ncbi:ImmA/IrrE family metallo-endopeptidase [bacterium]|nr:ImmA/IrrE family metallo-endopeptidase [bacterium]
MSNPIDLAQEWAASAWKRFDFELPVNLSLICKYLKINFRHKVMEDAVGGYLLRTPKRRYIVMNSNHELARQRFTIAHEIAEFLLDRRQEYSGRRYSIDGSQEPRERFCNRFAANLLMPAAAVLTQAQELHHSTRNNKTNVLASRFGVSEQAMRYRLNELALRQNLKY